LLEAFVRYNIILLQCATSPNLLHVVLWSTDWLIDLDYLFFFPPSCPTWFQKEILWNKFSMPSLISCMIVKVSSFSSLMAKILYLQCLLDILMDFARESCGTLYHLRGTITGCIRGLSLCSKIGDFYRVLHTIASSSCSPRNE
jgi:hypothetical protein